MAAFCRCFLSSPDRIFFVFSELTWRHFVGVSRVQLAAFCRCLQSSPGGILSVFAELTWRHFVGVCRVHLAAFCRCFRSSPGGILSVFPELSEQMVSSVVTPSVTRDGMASTSSQNDTWHPTIIMTSDMSYARQC